MAGDCIDIRFTIPHRKNHEDDYLLSIHLRLRIEEISSKSIKAIKEEMIEVFRESYRLSFGELAQHHNIANGNQQQSQSNVFDFRKILFARHQKHHTYLPLLSNDDAYTIDHDEYDMVFVIVERMRCPASTTSTTSLLTSGLDQPDKLCLVYIIEDDGHALHIPTEREFWLLEEDISIGKAIWNIVDKSLVSKFDTQIDAKIPNVTLSLQYAHMLPPQPISIEITEILDRRDKNEKPYLAYNIQAYIEPLTWIVQRRYSEFKSLHHALYGQPSTDSGYIPRSSLPSFPYSKQVINESTHKLAVQRKDALEKYLKQLMIVAPEEVVSNVHLLTFLGAMRTTKPVQAKSSKLNRNVINLDNIQKSLSCLNAKTIMAGASPSALLNWGDLVLFRSVAFAGQLQRLATGSEFDHVGIVVPSRFEPSNLLILESTSEGVTMYPLVPRLQAYDHFKVSQYVVIRRLEGERTREQYDTLLNFLNAIEGTPYSFNISSLLAGLRSKTVTTATTDSETPEYTSYPPLPLSQKHKSFFCSELVAATLSTINILPETEEAAAYWPGSFSVDKELDSRLRDINSTYKYGDEISIDFTIMDIGRAHDMSGKTTRYGKRPQPVMHLNEDVKKTFSSSSSSDNDTDDDDDDDDDNDGTYVDDQIREHNRVETMQGIIVTKNDSVENQGVKKLYRPKATFQPSLL